jgi:hypothetical protein
MRDKLKLHRPADSVQIAAPDWREELRAAAPKPTPLPPIAARWRTARAELAQQQTAEILAQLLVEVRGLRAAVEAMQRRTP